MGAKTESIKMSNPYGYITNLRVYKGLNYLCKTITKVVLSVLKKLHIINKILGEEKKQPPLVQPTTPREKSPLRWFSRKQSYEVINKEDAKEMPEESKRVKHHRRIRRVASSVSSVVSRYTSAETYAGVGRFIPKFKLPWY